MNPQDPNQPAEPVTPVAPPVTPTEPASPSTPTQPSAQPTTPTTPAIDENAITEKVSKGVFDRLAEAFGLSKKEAQEQLPTDPKELIKIAEQKGSEAAKRILEEREKAEAEAEAQREQQIEEGAKTFQAQWARDYNEMAHLGSVPKIVNAEDKNDPGNVAKVRILTKLKQMLDENEKNDVDHVPSLWEVMARFPNVLRTDTTTGANVPVSGGGRSMTPTGGSLPYNELHKTDVDDLVKQKYQS